MAKVLCAVVGSQGIEVSDGLASSAWSVGWTLESMVGHVSWPSYGFRVFGEGGYSGHVLSHVDAGSSCGAAAVVVMSGSDYESVRGGFTGFNLEDVALILPAVALVWAVAWLFKRLLAVLRNQL